MKGKICLITGANSGIGKATAIGLAQLGANIIILCRNQKRAKKTLAEIVKKTHNESINLMIVDLASQHEIHRFITNFKANYDGLDVLINNAGVYLRKRSLTAEGIEKTFAINHLGHFLLTNLLLDQLKKRIPSRIIVVSSEADRGCTINFNDINLEKKYTGMLAYRQSKLANILFTYALAERLQYTGVTVNCVHPGLARTNIGRSYGILGSFWKFNPFFPNPNTGAETSLYIATSHEVTDVSGKYFIKKKVIRSSPESYDKRLQKRLWELSIEYTGL